uniref:Tumor necrosis factor alpha-induced protein 2-like n=1 Tax=Hippocampus comes TaxID=109280 RepID=A0A3Q3DPK0_HIPCM
MFVCDASDSPQKHDGFKWSTLAPLSNPLRKAAAEKKPPGKAAGGPKLNLKFPKVWGPKAPQVRRNSTSTTDKRTEPQDIPDLTAFSASAPPAPPPPALTFEQHLSALHLSEAGRLLLAREERLFVGGPDDKAPPLEVPSGDVDALAADRQTLEEAVLQTLRGSLDQMDADALKSAVTFMQQEDECDDGWEQYGGMAPPWRLRGWRQLHDETLRSLVEERMDAPPTPSTEQSSIQADVHGMGRRLRRDLLLVAERVKPCYPSHLAICQLYATWYHHCISIRLRRLADFGLDDRDCTFLLRWVNDYYPQLLQEPQLARELTTYVGRILDQAQEAWTKGEEPPKEDGCFVSPTAYDVIQVRYRITVQLSCLPGKTIAFRTFQAQVIKRNKANSAAFVKANLGCVAQFRHFLSTQSRLFPEDVREGCLSVLSDMKQSAHDYLLNPVHRNLKLCYRKLFSQEWLKKSTLVLLLSGLEDEMPQLQGSSESCHRELIGQLHQEVSVEYARRLLKGELRLKDKQQQQQAADNVDDDACALHDFFARHGSEEAWLQKALSMMAEILKLQDLPAIQCQVASLGSDFPDFSEKHVMSLLKLKCSLTKEDRMNIQAVLAEIPKDCGRSRPFFSFVLVK